MEGTVKIRWHVIGLIAVIWFDLLFVYGICIAYSIESMGIGFGDNPEPPGFFEQ